MGLISIRQYKKDSLLVENSRAHYRLSKKLESAVEKFNEKKLFITLTYDHNNYDSPAQLYRIQKEERHVRRFISRLANYVECDLTGRWICKLEFQQGGWVHFHIIMDSPKYIPQEHLNNIWGYGFTWINKIGKKHKNYFAKYASKTGGLPKYLLTERQRSIKVVRTSPGFWEYIDQPKKVERLYVNKNTRFPAYSPVATIFKQKTIIRINNSQTTLDVDVGSFCNILSNVGCNMLSNDAQWINYHATRQQLSQAIIACYRQSSPSSDSWPQGGGHARHCGAPLLDKGGNSAKKNLDDLSLIKKGGPPMDPGWWRDALEGMDILS